MLVAAVDTADIDLLPLNGDVVCLEDGLDGLGNLGADTITFLNVSQGYAQYEKA